MGRCVECKCASSDLNFGPGFWTENCSRGEPRRVDMKLNLDDLKKLESSSIPSRPVDSRETVAAIVKVKKPNYVPEEVHIRAQISPKIITCEFRADQLAALEQDQNVESISIERSLKAE